MLKEYLDNADKRRILFNRAVVEGADQLKKAYYDAQNAPLTEEEQKEWDKYTAPSPDKADV